MSSLINFRVALLGEDAARELAAREAASAPHAARRKRAARVTLASAKKQADKAGLFLASAEIYADHVRVEFGEPTPIAPKSAVNPWDEILQ